MASEQLYGCYFVNVWLSVKKNPSEMTLLISHCSAGINIVRLGPSFSIVTFMKSDVNLIYRL